MLVISQSVSRVYSALCLFRPVAILHADEKRLYQKMAQLLDEEDSFMDLPGMYIPYCRTESGQIVECCCNWKMNTTKWDTYQIDIDITVKFPMGEEKIKKVVCMKL